MQRLVSCAADKWATDLRYKWSRARHFNSPKVSTARRDLYPATLLDVSRTARALFDNFVYTNDGIFRLYDSIDTPAGAWERAWNPGPLRDDCDGFHAALLWAVNVKMKSYLITVVSTDIVRSHTALYLPLYSVTGYVIDYTRRYGPGSLGELINQIKEAHNMPGVIMAELSAWDDRAWGSYKTLRGGL